MGELQRTHMYLLRCVELPLNQFFHFHLKAKRGRVLTEGRGKTVGEGYIEHTRLVKNKRISEESTAGGRGKMVRECYGMKRD